MVMVWRNASNVAKIGLLNKGKFDLNKGEASQHLDLVL